MNLFYLDANPKIAAEYHCDKHVCKMIVETAQMLSTAHHLCGHASDSIYKPAYPNHPMTVWVRTNSANYTYAYMLFCSLLSEYHTRYGKTHKSSKLVSELSMVPSRVPNSFYQSPLPLCMPDQYKIEGSPIKSYQNYYVAEKSRFARYTRRTVPYFFSILEQKYDKNDWQRTNNELFIFGKK